MEKADTYEMTKNNYELKNVQKGTGINAIPETTEYANGWNDCRKQAFEKKQQALKEQLKQNEKHPEN